jgi:DNA-binding response OmpR family regulator
MSWLRKAIEKDPRNPEFLITMRGMGYRLDV